MTEGDIAKLLKGRALIDAYRAEHAKGSIDKSAKLTQDIIALGFTSLADFFEFNEQMSIQAIKDMPVLGECDICAGYNGIPECQSRFGSGACGAKGIKIKGELLYSAILYRIRAGDFGTTDDWKVSLNFLKANIDRTTGIYWFCPKGHGFYCKPFEVVPGKFSLTWK